MIKPMKAVAASIDQLDFLLDDPNYWLQEKLDGVRFILHRHNSLVTCYSYNLKSFRNGLISEHMDSTRNFLPPDTIIDGEIWGDQAAAITAGIVNSHNNPIDSLSFHAFDCLRWGGSDLTLSPLWKRLGVLYGKLGGGRGCLSTIPIVQAGLKRTQFDKIFRDPSSEGVVLKHRLGAYMIGKRPVMNWYKYKKWDTWDVVITGFNAAKDFTIKKSGDVSASKYSGLIGSFSYGMYRDGKLVKLGDCSGMDDGTRRDMTRHPEKWIGRVVEIGGRQQLPSGAIHHSAYKLRREDKDPEDCVYK